MCGHDSSLHGFHLVWRQPVVSCPLQGICWKVQIFFTASEFLFSFVSIRYDSVLKSKQPNSSHRGLSTSNHRLFHKRTTCSQEISYSLIVAKLGKQLFSRYYSIGDTQLLSLRILFKMYTTLHDTPDNSWSLNLGRIWFSGPKSCCNYIAPDARFLRFIQCHENTLLTDDK